ncbi:methionine ABC transporter permease [Oscillospiraceae bacterium]|nr:methionine ABC transporter permease [Oscillospiraceae bacterium]BDF74184.1 methionine ABC transporter permease [Oscillospiraceae bacterium]
MTSMYSMIVMRDPNVADQIQRLIDGVPFAVWETVYTTVVATFFAYLIGLPLGVLLVAGEQGGVRPLPRTVMSVLNVAVNLLRSVPFLILMVLVIPLSRLILGTSIGTVATIIPLIVAAFPFVARLVESSLRELDKGVVEAAQAMGASPFQIIRKVMIPECLPSLISGFTTAFITILSYGAMSGAIGGGGLGSMALNLGYQRQKTVVLWGAVIVLVILVQIFQSIGTYLSVKLDKRLAGKAGGRRARKAEKAGIQ